MSTSYDAESIVSRQRVTTLVLSLLAICFLILRLVSRRLKRVSLGVDDWTLIVGMVFVAVSAGLNYASTYYGMGRHYSVLEPEDGIMFLKLLYVFEPIYITSVGIIKISVLLMYHRIFPVPLIRIGGYILGGVTIAWVVSVDLVAIFQCTPVEKAFNRMLPGHCIDLKAALIGNGVPNFVTDICILALPGHCIWNLQASFWQRVSIIGVFLTGSFVVFASIYRFSLIFKLDILDIPWTLADAQTWCVVETSAGVISACLPTIIPLIKYITKGVISTTQSRSKSNTNTHNSKSHPHSQNQLNAEEPVAVATGQGRRSKSEFDFPLGELPSTSRGSHGMKAQGWTIIRAEGDSD